MAIKTRRVVAPTEAGSQTKERILAAAQRLFANDGFEGVSMREIGTEADVPFALVTYHFGTKLNLYKSVFFRHRGILYTDRLKALETITITGKVLVDLRAISFGLVEPFLALKIAKDGHEIMRLMGREINNPVESTGGIVEEFFDPVARLALQLLQSAVPAAPLNDVCLAFYFATGAIAINHVNNARLERLSSGKLKRIEHASLVSSLTTFIAAGMASVLKIKAR